MIIRITLVLILLLSFSCQRKENKTLPEPQAHAAVDVVPRDADPGVQNATNLYDTTTLVVETQPETTDADEDAKSTSVTILFTGTFHGNEIEEGVDKLPWLGLFPDQEGGFVLEKTSIEAKRVFDAIIDNEGEKTGWEISTENEHYPIILLSGGDFMKGKIEAVNIPNTLYPGDSVQLEFHDAHYLLYATGVDEYDTVTTVHYVSNYELHVVRTYNSQSTQTLLVSHPNFDDAMTSILWGGDLDRDRSLDFLIDLSRHYNQRIPTLFLSKPAGEEVVEPVAEHTNVGC